MMLRKQFHKNRRGFTLIELLVVVAIIALLISILLPSLDRARRQARQLVCATNLKSQHDAALLYAADNDDYIPRGMVGITGSNEIGDLYPGYNSYATAIMPYLGWNGNKNVKLSGSVTVDINANTMDLWTSAGRESPYGSGGNFAWRARFNAMSTVEQFQCPDFPPFEPNPETQWDPDIAGAALTDMPLDYVSSAVPIPYALDNYTYDQSRMTFEFFEPPEPVPMDQNIYMERSRLEDFTAGVSPADYIYVTECHTGLDTMNGTGRGLMFHHFFAGCQLPFAFEPRMAVDSRHPAGLNAMFFDGHVETLELHEVDPACAAEGDFACYTNRLKRITYVPASFED